MKTAMLSQEKFGGMFVGWAGGFRQFYDRGLVFILLQVERKARLCHLFF